MLGWGEFFALASAVSWAVSVILFRRSGASLPAFELNFFKIVLGFLLFIPTLLLVDGVALPDFSAGQLAVVLVSGLLGIAVADTWYLRALNLMGASRTGIVSSLLSPFVILLSVLFLGEALRGWQIVGFVFVMGGILLVTWRKARSEVGLEDVRKGVLFGVGGVFLMAVGVVMVKEILETRSFIWTVELRLLGGLLGMVIYITASRRWSALIASYSGSMPWGYIISGSFLGSYVSMMLWLAGYKLIPASVASILNETANAWIVVLAWLVLGEALSVRKISGLMLTMLGVAIMLLL